MGWNCPACGEVGPGSGWIGRAQRLLEREPDDTVERGYLLMPLVFQHEAAGNFESGAAVAAESAAIAERFGDADGFALATHAQGLMLIKAGRVQEGLALLDEAMVAVLARELGRLPKMADWKDARRRDATLLSEWQVYRMVDVQPGAWSAFQFLVSERLREEGVAIAPDGTLRR